MMLDKKSVASLALLAVSMLLGRRLLSDVLTLAIRNDEYTQILLIMPVSITFMLLERPWRRIAPIQNFELGFSLIGGAAAIGIARWFWRSSIPNDVGLSIGMTSLVLLWIGIFVLSFGSAIARSAMFPLLFLFGLIPLPEAILNAVVALLQAGSAWSVHILFTLVGVPVVQDGNFLTIPGLTLQVAQECSSIRSSSMLLVTAIVLAQLLLRSSMGKVLVVCLVIPLSVLKNGLRIFTIAMLGTRVDPGYLNGKLHHQGGILFFLFALLGLFLALAICQKAESGALKLGSRGKLHFHNI